MRVSLGATFDRSVPNPAPIVMAKVAALSSRGNEVASEGTATAVSRIDRNRDYFASEALRSSSTLRAIRNALTPAGIPQ